MSDSESLPPNIIGDLGYSIAMFIIGLAGLRFVLQDQWGMDILDFNTMPAKIAAGTVSLITLFSIYQTIADPKKAQKLGRQLAGRDYNYQTAQRSIQAGQQGMAERDMVWRTAAYAQPMR